MKKIKIVIGITNSLSAVLIKGQPTFLKNRGFDVTIFSSSGEEISYLRKREKFNLKFINYTREISLISDVSALFATYTALKKIKPDIINAGTPKAAFLLMIAAYFMGTPVRIFTLR